MYSYFRSSCFMVNVSDSTSYFKCVLGFVISLLGVGCQSTSSKLPELAIWRKNHIQNQLTPLKNVIFQVWNSLHIINLKQKNFLEHIFVLYFKYSKGGSFSNNVLSFFPQVTFFSLLKYCGAKISAAISLNNLTYYLNYSHSHR